MHIHVPIEADIDRRKLTFLGQLCSLDTSSVIKTVFVNRLMAFLNNPSCISGVIPDMYRLCKKYNLLTILNRYISDGVFPSKYTWKTIVKSNIQIVYKHQFLTRIEENAVLKNYSIVHDLTRHSVCLQ